MKASKKTVAKAAKKQNQEQPKQREMATVIIPEPATLSLQVNGPDGKPLMMTLADFAGALGQDCPHFMRNFASICALQAFVASLRADAGISVSVPRDDLVVIAAKAVDPGPEGYPAMPIEAVTKNEDGTENVTKIVLRPTLDGLHRLISALVKATDKEGKAA